MVGVLINVAAVLAGGLLGLAPVSYTHLIRDSLEEWLSGNRARAFYDMDCGDILRIQPNGNDLWCTVFWLSRSYNK